MRQIYRSHSNTHDPLVKLSPLSFLLTDSLATCGIHRYGGKSLELHMSNNPNESDNKYSRVAEDESIVLEESSSDLERRNTIINVVAGGLLAAVGVASWQLYSLTVYTPPGFVRVSPTRFVAALGSPTAQQGTNAQEWGMWRQDPGPRGVFLQNYETDLVQRNNVAPIGGWTFNPQDWWIEEHGTCMKKKNR